jgi:hypothetical protein
MPIRHIPWLRVFVEGVVIVVSILLAFGIQATIAEAQARSDSLAVIAASLEGFGGGFWANDSPEIVLAATRLLPPGIVRPAGERFTFCDAEIALDGHNVGGRVAVSLTPGQGPPPESPPPSDSVAPRAPRPVPTPPRDFTRVFTDRWHPAFYIDEEIAYVSVSGGCWRGEDGGRRVSSFSYGVTCELRRDGTRWVVTDTVGSWIT